MKQMYGGPMSAINEEPDTSLTFSLGFSPSVLLGEMTAYHSERSQTDAYGDICCLGDIIIFLAPGLIQGSVLNIYASGLWIICLACEVLCWIP